MSTKNKIPSYYKSATPKFHRDPMKSTQVYKEKTSDGSDTLGQPIPHVSADKQVTGEALYLDDMPKYAGSVLVSPCCFDLYDLYMIYLYYMKKTSETFKLKLLADNRSYRVFFNCPCLQKVRNYSGKWRKCWLPIFSPVSHFYAPAKRMFSGV